MSGTGSYSGMFMESTRRAEELQALALRNIHIEYEASKPFDLYTLTLGEFADAVEQSRRDGTAEEFDEQLRAILKPLIQQITAPPQP